MIHFLPFASILFVLLFCGLFSRGSRDWKEIRKGFIDASTLYRPHITKFDRVGSGGGGGKSKSHSKGGSQAGSMMDMSASISDFDESASSQYLGKPKNKALSADDPKVKKLSDRISACRSGVDLGVKDDLGEAFWNKIPEEMIVTKKKQIRFYSDIDAVEGLLRRECNPQSLDEPQINFVVWVLGKPPSDSELPKAENIFRLQAAARGRVALLIILASEFRYDLDTKKEDVIEKMANPFKHFIKRYNAVVSEYTEEEEEEGHSASFRFNGPKAACGALPKGASMWGKQLQGLSVKKRKSIVGDNEPDELPAAPRLKLLQLVSWAEVMAKSFVKEDKANALREKRAADRARERAERAAAEKEEKPKKRRFLRGPFVRKEKAEGKGGKSGKKGKASKSAVSAGSKKSGKGPGSDAGESQKSASPSKTSEREKSGDDGDKEPSAAKSKAPQSNYPNLLTVSIVLLLGSIRLSHCIIIPPLVIAFIC